MSLKGIKAASEVLSKTGHAGHGGDCYLKKVHFVPDVVIWFLQFPLSPLSHPLRWDLLSFTQEAPADLTFVFEPVSYVCAPQKHCAHVPLVFNLLCLKLGQGGRCVT